MFLDDCSQPGGIATEECESFEICILKDLNDDFGRKRVKAVPVVWRSSQGE